MTTGDPSLVFEALIHTDVAQLDVVGTIDASKRLRYVRGVLDSFEAQLTGRIGELHAQGQGAPAEETYTRNQGVSAAEARRKQRRSKILDEAPSFGEALATGAVGAEHADVLANVTAGLDDAIKASLLEHEGDLLAKATTSSPEDFKRTCQQTLAKVQHDAGVARAERQKSETRLSRRIDASGMHHVNATYHPEMGEAVNNVINRQIDALIASKQYPDADRQQLAAYAMHDLLVGGHQQARPVEAEITLIIDADTLCSDLHDHSVCEYTSGVPVPPETVRRMCCNGRLIPLVIGQNGVPLDMGRDIRLANRAQRRALRALYRTCAFPGCDVAFHRCEIHHIVPYELGGVTDLANLIPVCSRHHHLVHEMRWRLTLDADRTLTVWQPDGATYATAPIQISPAERNRDRHRRRDGTGNPDRDHPPIRPRPLEPRRSTPDQSAPALPL